jgi:hypothetical protein
MTYEEWLNLIEELKTGNTNIEKLNKIKSAEINTNFNDLLEPKLEKLIKERFNTYITKIINDLGNIFSDMNYLDLVLLNYQKEIRFLIELSSIKQLSSSKQFELTQMIKKEANKVFDILNKEAMISDYTGALTSIINNYRIKWE